MTERREQHKADLRIFLHFWHAQWLRWKVYRFQRAMQKMAREQSRLAKAVEAVTEANKRLLEAYRDD